MIQKERIRYLKSGEISKGEYVIYWMQASQRSEYNHALEFAIEKANELQKPLVVFFGISSGFLESNRSHYLFMLEGLKEVGTSLEKRKIKFVIQLVSPEKGVVRIAENACLVITDVGYLKIQRKWRSYVSKRLKCPFIEIETNVIIPVREASPKEEYSAATFRPKIHKKLYYYLSPIRKRKPAVSALGLSFDSLNLKYPTKVLQKLKSRKSRIRSYPFKGGETHGHKLLDVFLKSKIHHYDQSRNDPTKDCLSNMSPYLHFGQISPLQVAMKVLKKQNTDNQAYLEELIVRREIAVNFVYYNSLYDSYEGLPQWAIKSLEKHKKDKRSHIYSTQDLEKANTHDPYWNAAQKEMMITGKMHGYMRMYWGKKILEWNADPKEAFEIALHLNNKYELDGRDPNGYCGVAWCFGKHDHPWFERPVFGKIRYMNANGLRRKFAADRYVEKIRKLENE